MDITADDNVHEDADVDDSDAAAVQASAVASAVCTSCYRSAGVTAAATGDFVNGDHADAAPTAAQ